MQVEFSRNPLSFPLNTYLQIAPTDAVVAYYAELSSSDPVTVVSQEDHVWPDGQERPVGRKRPLRWNEIATERRTYPYTLGGLTVDQASFDIVASHGRGEAARCMTDRTIDAKTVLEATGNWASANYSATADALLGGTGATWIGSGATVAAQYIKQSFNAVMQAIQKETGGVVVHEQMCCVVNPVTADGMARSPEILEYLKFHNQSPELLSNRSRRFLDRWGLPQTLYGVEMCVDDAVYQSSQREIDGSGTRAYIYTDNTAIFISRVGGLVGEGQVNQNAAPSYSTLTGFFKEEMNVETESDGWNRLVKGAVTDDRDIVLTAPASGYLIADVST